MPDLASSLATPPAALPPPSGTEAAHSRQDLMNREPGPLRNGNKRGNPALAPRCGAKNRAGGACQAPALRGHTRCRLHGGASTGPRTAAGLARLAASHTSHGRETEAMRAEFRHRQVTLGRMRVLRAAVGLKAWLPEAQRARLTFGSVGVPELRMPAHPGLAGLALEAVVGPEDGRRDARGRFVQRATRTRRGVAGEREAARAERAALAPWRAAIAEARVARRAAWEEKRGSSRQDLVNREDGVGSGSAAGAQVVGGRDTPGHDTEGRGTGDLSGSRQDPMNREPGRGCADGAEAGARSPRPCGPRDDTAVLVPPPGLTRKQRKRWKWVQRQARKARGGPAVTEAS